MESFLKKISKDNDNFLNKMKYLSQEKRNLNIKYSELKKEFNTQIYSQNKPQSITLKIPTIENNRDLLIKKNSFSHLKEKRSKSKNDDSNPIFTISKVNIITKKPEGPYLHGYSPKKNLKTFHK